MSNFTIIAHGWDRVIDALSPGHLEELQKEALERIVFTVEGNVKAVTPVRTGNLRRSVTGVVENANRGLVGTNVSYAIAVHRRKPYMEQGLDASRPAIEEALARIGKQFVSQVGP